MKIQIKTIGFFSFATKKIYSTIEECKAATSQFNELKKSVKQNTQSLINWVKDGLKDTLKQKPSFKRWATIATYKAIIKDLIFNDWHENINLV